MDDRDEIVKDMMPQDWDTSAYHWMMQFKKLAETMPNIKVTGSGGGDGFADFSFQCGDHRFWVDFKRQQIKH
jgi:hypothetical protein